METPYFLIDRAFGEELLHVPIVDVCVNVPIYQEPLGLFTFIFIAPYWKENTYD